MENTETTSKKKVVLMRGQSGSGKSTYIRKNHPRALVCSADHFFEDEKGNYNFDGSQLGLAHKTCQSKFARALHSGVPEVVVDNTNTTPKEMEFYYNLAKQNGYDVEIVQFDVEPEVSHKRNAHGVPLDAVRRQYDRMKASNIPASWDVVVKKA